MRNSLDDFEVMCVSVSVDVGVGVGRESGTLCIDVGRWTLDVGR